MRRCRCQPIFEVTTLDVVRADKFVHEMTGLAMDDIGVPVIGSLAAATSALKQDLTLET